MLVLLACSSAEGRGLGEKRQRRDGGGKEGRETEERGGSLGGDGSAAGVKNSRTGALECRRGGYGTIQRKMERKAQQQKKKKSKGGFFNGHP